MKTHGSAVWHGGIKDGARSPYRAKEKDVVLAGQVGVAEHARIGEGVMLGGQTGVLPHKILRGRGIAFWGTPARPLREVLKDLATLARLTRKE